MCRATRWPAILLAAVLAIAGCTATVSGTALPAATLGHTTTTATTGPTPRIIGVSVLEGLLLTGDQIVGLVGGTNMVSVGTINNTSDAATIIDDRTCIGIGSIADMSVYSNSGWVAMRGNQFTSPNVVQADVTQVVTSFTGPADATALLQHARQAWQACANGRYSFHSSNGTTVPWTPDPFGAAAPAWT
ncbi:hypothetical protein MSIMFB_05148 [Mycobacterium simulans]|uniref:PknH-like extracellular domain-containing protein n=1 Tax=Mycobacterium simulans TaxID=627089 RepID=A0A7Z7NC97_9MYCO|nr:hypothetical protein MSIMFB_05148 [Mycobacterium simulans]